VADDSPKTEIQRHALKEAADAIWEMQKERVTIQLYWLHALSNLEGQIAEARKALCERCVYGPIHDRKGVPEHSCALGD